VRFRLTLLGMGRACCSALGQVRVGCLLKRAFRYESTARPAPPRPLASFFLLETNAWTYDDDKSTFVGDDACALASRRQRTWHAARPPLDVIFADDLEDLRRRRTDCWLRRTRASPNATRLGRRALATNGTPAELRLPPPRRRTGA